MYSKTTTTIEFETRYVSRQLLEGFRAISVSLYLAERVSKTSRAVFFGFVLTLCNSVLCIVHMYVTLFFVKILAASEQASQLEEVL
jgi:hypothetical protein